MQQCQPPKPPIYPSGPNREVNRLIRNLGGLRAAAAWFDCSEQAVRDYARLGRLSATQTLWVLHRIPGEYEALDLSPRTQEIPERLRVTEGEAEE